MCKNINNVMYDSMDWQMTSYDKCIVKDKMPTESMFNFIIKKHSKWGCGLNLFEKLRKPMGEAYRQWANAYIL